MFEYHFCLVGLIHYPRICFFVFLVAKQKIFNKLSIFETFFFLIMTVTTCIKSKNTHCKTTVPEFVTFTQNLQLCCAYHMDTLCLVLCNACALQQLASCVWILDLFLKVSKFAYSVYLITLLARGCGFFYFRVLSSFGLLIFRFFTSVCVLHPPASWFV